MGMNSVDDFYIVFGSPSSQEYTQVYQVNSAHFVSPKRMSIDSAWCFHENDLGIGYLTNKQKENSNNKIKYSIEKLLRGEKNKIWPP